MVRGLGVRVRGYSFINVRMSTELKTREMKTSEVLTVFSQLVLTAFTSITKHAKMSSHHHIGHQSSAILWSPLG